MAIYVNAILIFPFDSKASVGLATSEVQARSSPKSESMERFNFPSGKFTALISQTKPETF
jgi:hypothetical protein